VDQPQRLSRIDWGRPWFAPWRAAGEAVAARHSAGVAVAEALNMPGAAPVRFVAATALPEGTPYESHIFATRECPTRDNLHDFFNGLAWHVLPTTKQQINRVQASEIARHGIAGERGPVRDACTLFDENGAVLAAPAPLWDALRRRAWRELFVDLRPFWEDAHLLVVGHAMLEQLCAPRKNLTAHVWAEPAPRGATVAQLDAWLAAQLQPARLATKPFLPLPVSGVPGWTAANADFSFYDDPLVFRPAAGPEPTTTRPAATPRP
jgi:hypothetical protein